eukprot:m51a1_g8814 putative pas domain-containing protein tyrosine kinase (1282) ;mRNA; f:301374-305909
MQRPAAMPWLLALAVACAASASGDGVNGSEGGSLVIGMACGPSLMERSFEQGFRAAYEDFRLITRLPFELASMPLQSQDKLLDTAKVLVESRGASIAVGKPGSSAIEKEVVHYLRQRSVPLVAALSGSAYLRNFSSPDFFAEFSRPGGGGANGTGGGGGSKAQLPVVTTVRAAGINEMHVVLSMLSRDWGTVTSVALLAHNTPLGLAMKETLSIGLSFLVNNTIDGVSVPSFLFPSEQGISQRDLEAAEQKVLQHEPRTLVVCTAAQATVAYVKWLAASRHSNKTVYMMSWSSAADLAQGLTAQERARLAGKDIRLFFTQTMPFPTPDDDTLEHAPQLLRKFHRANVTVRSHAALEGYLTGWFIYEAAQKAAARYGLPLTPAALLSTIYADLRTFDVLGMTLGPYGDGGRSGGRQTLQSLGDQCNQGVRQVYLTRFELPGGQLRPRPGASLKFAWCTPASWYVSKSPTMVGITVDPRGDEGMFKYTGLLAATQAYSSTATNTVVVRSIRGGLDKAGDLGSGIPALFSPRLNSSRDAEHLTKSRVLIAPMPVFCGLVRPFKRDVINLFPSAHDEINATIQFFVSGKAATDLGVNKVYVFKNARGDAYVDELAQRGGDIFDFSEKDEADVPAMIRKHASSDNRTAFVVLGGTFNSTLVEGVEAIRLLGSQVVAPQGSIGGDSQQWTFQLRLSPPASHFASTSALRSDYRTWVSGEDSNEVSFRSFFAGRFLMQVIDKAKSMKGTDNTSLTSKDLVDAVYEKGTFTIEGVQIGPFAKSCSSPSDCCNQGLNTVYVLEGGPQRSVAFTYQSSAKCGKEFALADTSASDNNGVRLGVGLGVGLGGALIICTAFLSAVIWRSKSTVEFLNIRRGELELGQCMGQGRFGSMYMADWHGTTVAVRMIDKKATPKEDQRLIKEEVLLLHKHHHPNLLMLMGYCETRNEIFVVTEFMEGGTLADYLRKEKQFTDTRTLISMAFVRSLSLYCANTAMHATQDVLKGIAYLHSCKPPIVHGSICTRNLLMDGKGTVKVSDLWYSSKKGALSSSGSSKTLKRAAWQPPEVIAGTILTPATDVYAFGIVLWELIAPAEMTMSSSASGTVSESLSAQSCSTAGAGAVPLRLTVDGVVELRTPMGPPELPPNATPELADLLTRCWHTQPERRPSVFQILRNWPATFATLGHFEIPKDLDIDVDPPSCAGAPPVYSQRSSVDLNSNDNKREARDDLSDDMAASMVSFMPVRLDSDALQTPCEPELRLSVAGPEEVPAQRPRLCPASPEGRRDAPRAQT